MTAARPARRSLLLGSAAATAGLTGGLVFPATSTTPRAHAEGSEAGPDDYAQVRANWRTALTGGDITGEDPRLLAAAEAVDTAARSALEDFSPTAPLWPDLPFGEDAANVAVALQRMADVATAWATPTCELFEDADVAADLVAALEVVHVSGYNPDRAVTGNWWNWEIGVPNSLTDVLVLLYDEVPEDLRTSLVAAFRHFAPDPNHRSSADDLIETGANRVDKALRCALRGAIDDDAADLELARDALSDVAGNGANSVFGFVTSGDGFYEDGSFVQHDHLPYVGTYGNVALTGIANILALLIDTPWEVTDEDQGMILEAIEASFAPFIWQSVMMDTVRGRAVSRQEDTGRSNALATAASALRLVPAAADDAQRLHLAGRARGWIERSALDVGEQLPLPDVARLVDMEDEGIDPVHDTPGLQLFADQDRIVHKREDWAFTVSTSSSRIGRYEWGNKENATGWYQGDGVTFALLADDPAQTDTNFWPTVDPYRLPGTTVEMTEREPSFADGTGIPRAEGDWAGGSTVLDAYGAFGADHSNHDDSLQARTSWFLLDDLVVALGAGITSSTGAEVETTIDNRALHEGAPVLRIDGDVVADEDGASDTFTSPEWAHLEGFGGYVFLDAEKLRVRRETRSGRWSDINGGDDTGGEDEAFEVTYATLSALHGVAPQGATYAYALAPTASRTRTRALARRMHTGKEVAVLVNTADVQAIRAELRPGTVWLTNAFAAAELEHLAIDGPASVSVGRRLGRIHIGVSDPSRTAETVTLTLPELTGRRVQEADGSVEILDLDPVRLRVDVGGSRGHAHTAVLRY